MDEEMDEGDRVDWLCTILDYVAEGGRWGMRDVDVLRALLRDDGGAWLAEYEGALLAWYGPRHCMPREMISGL